MKLSYLFIPLVVTLLTFTGCGDDSTDDACVYGVQQNLDKGDYALVIATLENNQTCGGKMAQDDAWLNLAAAYMGKAGLTMGNLLGAVTDSNSSSAMSSFMTSFADAATAEGLANLDNAAAVYAYFGVACNGTETGADAEACLYDGLVSLTSAVSSLSTLLGAETVAALSGTLVTGGPDDVNNNDKVDQIEITSCALEDADNNLTGCTGTPTPTTHIASTTLFNGDANTYAVRLYTVTTSTGYSDATAYKLIRTDTAPDEAVTTDGFCDTNEVTCSAISGTCFPCPVRAADGSATTVVSGLVTTINNGDLESLANFLPAEDNGADANITADITTSVYEDCIAAGGAGACIDNGLIDNSELPFFLDSL